MGRLKSAMTGIRIPPAADELAAGLSRVLVGPSGRVEVVARHPNVHASTFPSEFVSCRIPNGELIEVFCKYAEDEIDTCFGHRGSTRYEGDVYMRLLGEHAAAIPRFLGTYAEPESGWTWLVLERIDGGRQIAEVDDPEPGMRAMARWVGTFHSRMARGDDRSTDFLIRHDGEYYEGWIHRTREFGRPLVRQYPWLEHLPDFIDPLIDPLLAADRVVVHGELYPHNLLFRGETAFALDWQSAAVAAGEIDLAALTERWPEDVVLACEEEYRAARWPTGAPDWHQRAVEAARLHWLCRWLGDRPQWTVADRSVWRLEQLGEALRRLQLL